MAFSPAMRGGESMGWLKCMLRFRKKFKKPRPKKEKYLVPIQRKEIYGWKVLNDQLMLDHWFKSNGIR